MNRDKQILELFNIIPELTENVRTDIKNRWDFAGMTTGDEQPDHIECFKDYFSCCQHFKIDELTNMIEMFSMTSVGKIFDEELKRVYSTSGVEYWYNEWKGMESFSAFVKRKANIEKKSIISVSSGVIVNRLFQNPGAEFQEADKANLAAGVLGRVGNITVVVDRKRQDLICWMNPDKVYINVPDCTVDIQILRTGVFISYRETFRLLRKELQTV